MHVPAGLRRALVALGVGAAMVALAYGAATTYLAMTLDEILAATDVAVFGEVESASVVERDGMPWTRVRIVVERDLSSDDGGREDVELWFLGGSLPAGASLVVAGMPRFEPGERLLVLAYDDVFSSPIVGFSQGLWRVVGDRLVAEDGTRLGFEGDALASNGEPAPIDALLTALQERLKEQP